MVEKVERSTAPAGESEKAQWDFYWGIINPHGQPWTPRVFPSAELAQQFLRNFWPNETEQELQKFKVEKVKVTIERLPTPTGGDDA